MCDAERFFTPEYVNSDLKDMTHDQLEDRLRYYNTVQGQRALTNIERMRHEGIIRALLGPAA